MHVIQFTQYVSFYKINIRTSKAKQYVNWFCAICFGWTLHTANLQAQQSLNEIEVRGKYVSTSIDTNQNKIQLSGITLSMSSGSHIFEQIQHRTPVVSMISTGANVFKPMIHGQSHYRVGMIYDGIPIENQAWGDEHGIETGSYFLKNMAINRSVQGLESISGTGTHVIYLEPELPDTGQSFLHGQIIQEYNSNNKLFGYGSHFVFSKRKQAWSVEFSNRMAGNYQNNQDGYVYNTCFAEINAAAHYISYFKHTKLQISGTWYHNEQAIPDGSRAVFSRAFTKQIYESDADTLEKRPIVSSSELQQRGIPILHQRIIHGRLYAKLQTRKSTYLIGFQQNNRQEFNHPTAPEIPGLSLQLSQFFFQYQHTFSNAWKMGIQCHYQRNLNQEASVFTIPNYVKNQVGIWGSYERNWVKNQIAITGRIDQIQRMNPSQFITLNSKGWNTLTTDSSDGKILFPTFHRTFIESALAIKWKYIKSTHFQFSVLSSFHTRSPSTLELQGNGLDPGSHIIFIGNPGIQNEKNVLLEPEISIQNAWIHVTSGVFINPIFDYLYQAGNGERDAQGNIVQTTQQTNASIHGWFLQCEGHKKLPGIFRKVQWDAFYSGTRGYQLNADRTWLPLMPSDQIHMRIQRTFRQIPRIQMMHLIYEPHYQFAQNRIGGLWKSEVTTAAYFIQSVSIQIPIQYSAFLHGFFKLSFENLTNTNYQSNLSRLRYMDSEKLSVDKTGIFNPGRSIHFKLIALINK